MMEKKSIICDFKDDTIDWSSVRELLANNKIVKVFHSASQDIEVLQYFLGIKLYNIFDTQIAAAFLGGNETIGYDKLVKRFLGCTIDKTLQFSDWEIRPLSDAQVEYAAFDVKYLYCLYPKLKKSLGIKYTWAQDEMSKLYHNHLEAKSQSIFRKFIVQKLGKSIDDSTLHKAIVHWKIILYREMECRSQNKSHNEVMSDTKIRAYIDHLISIYPHNIGKENFAQILRKIGIDERICTNMTNFLEGQTSNYQEDCEKMTIILKNLIDKKHLMVHITKKPIYHLVKTLLHVISTQNNIAHSIIADSDDVFEIALSVKLPLKFTRGWRYEVFGSHLESLLNGQSSISVDERMEVILKT